MVSVMFKFLSQHPEKIVLRASHLYSLCFTYVLFNVMEMLLKSTMKLLLLLAEPAYHHVIAFCVCIIRSYMLEDDILAS